MANPSNPPVRSGSTTMAELMAKHTSNFKILTRGEEITGKITKITGSEILMDVGTKTEALVIEKDRKLLKQLLQLISVGQEVTGTVINPESDLGYPLVSLRKSVESHMWQDMEKLVTSQEKMNVTITDATKGGFLVEAENGTNGFMPNSHVIGAQNPENMVGTTIQASIVEFNPEQKRVIFSQKGILTHDQFAKMASAVKIGDKVSVTVSSVTPFGLFVVIPGEKDLPAGKQAVVSLTGLVHVSEIGWEKIDDLGKHFTIGDKIDTTVIGLDTENRRLNLSIKRLSKDPFVKIAEAFPLEKKVSGKVIEATEQGLRIDLGQVEGVGAEGLIRKDKIPAATSYKVDQSITATVIGVDTKRRKILLTPVLLEKPLMYR